MNVIVFGATGKTGNQICQQLDSNKIKYSAFVRESSVQKISSNMMDVIKGDVLRKQDVEMALREKTFTHIVISLGSKSLRDSVRSDGTRNILEAMKTTGTVATVHVVSAFGVGDSWGQMKWSSKLLTRILLKSVMQDHDKQEQIVTNSPFKYHIVRPVGLKDTDPKGSVHIQSEGFLPGNTISRADVAIFLIESMMKGELGVFAIC